LGEYMKAFKKYFKKRIKAINSLLGKPRLTYTPDTFHKLRIEIKRLEAFFDLIKFCSKDFKRRKTYKPFKHIFRQAGKVRDLQVEETMMKKYFVINILNEYRSKLRNQRLKEQRDYFSIVYAELTWLRKSCSNTIPFLDQLDESFVNIFMEKRRKKIEIHMNQTPLQPSQIHKLRKLLKRFNYNQRCLEIKNPNDTKKEIYALDERLGKWQDCQVFIKHLELAMDAKGVSQEERNQLEEIRTNMVSESKLLFDKINETISLSELS
jgi:CHAD domain-containing protein